ncbi:MAG: hypothetical protein ACLFVB_10285 [Thermoplasmata archaeon]
MDWSRKEKYRLAKEYGADIKTADRMRQWSNKRFDEWLGRQVGEDWNKLSRKERYRRARDWGYTSAEARKIRDRGLKRIQTMRHKDIEQIKETREAELSAKRGDPQRAPAKTGFRTRTRGAHTVSKVAHSIPTIPETIRGSKDMMLDDIRSKQAQGYQRGNITFIGIHRAELTPKQKRIYDKAMRGDEESMAKLNRDVRFGQVKGMEYMSTEARDLFEMDKTYLSSQMEMLEERYNITFLALAQINYVAI